MTIAELTVRRDQAERMRDADLQRYNRAFFGGKRPDLVKKLWDRLQRREERLKQAQDDLHYDRGVIVPRTEGAEDATEEPADGADETMKGADNE